VSGVLYVVVGVGPSRDIDHGAFAVNPLRPTCAQAATALMDYFRSLHMYMVPVTWELYVVVCLACARAVMRHKTMLVCMLCLDLVMCVVDQPSSLHCSSSV